MDPYYEAAAGRQLCAGVVFGFMLGVVATQLWERLQQRVSELEQAEWRRMMPAAPAAPAAPDAPAGDDAAAAQ